MISKESVTNLLLVMSRFMTKKGADMESRRELAAAIGNVIGENSLDAIYINNTDNVLLPDVAVLHLYNTDFSRFILDPDGVVPLWVSRRSASGRSVFLSRMPTMWQRMKF